MTSSRRPRWLHPGAWWLWAIGLAAAASRTTNPILLLSILGVAALVVSARRPEAPWARSFVVFLQLGLFVVGFRLLFQVLFGAPQGNDVLITLPTVDLPGWLAGLRLGGQITAESLLAAVYDGLRLATVLACLGAATSLASPTRLLKAMPAALYEVGVAVVVALSFAPAMVADVGRVKTARRLRGRPSTGIRGVAGSAMPVFSGALERSVALAAAMDSRGYGRTAERTRGERRVTAALVLGGVVGVCLGLYALLDGSAASIAGAPILVLGVSAAGLGMWRSGRRSTRTRYRPDPWSWPEWVTAGSGLLAAATVIAVGVLNPQDVTTSVTPPVWPAVPPLALLGILIAAMPAFVTPEPPMPVRSPATIEAVPA